MQETPEFARLREYITPVVISELARLYDQAANSLDPHSPARAEAERLLNEELRGNYDLITASIPPPIPDFREFRRLIILLCRRHLKATDRPSSI